MMRKASKRTTLIIILLSLYGCVSVAQEMPIPINMQIALLSKILAFDRGLNTRVGEEIVIGVLHQRKFRVSLNVKDDMMRELNKGSMKLIENIPVQCVPIEIGETTDLEGDLSQYSIDIAYVTPLRAFSIDKLAEICRAKKILTVTGVPDYVESGLSVGIGAKGGRPQIIINLMAAKTEGVDFSSQLLKLAKIVE